MMPANSPDGSAGYTVLARRYRPQQFDECVGQEHVTRALANAIESGRVGHAYLFTGSRGVGKTSMARIFAKALNCVNGPTPRPCGVCDICQGVATGDDVDVLEIDGASNRGIDEVRELRQSVAYRPSRARFKIYIIDEVHMLSKDAFNALLKTLEEPPPHVKFFFATTEAQKIPITILSRCQRFDFAGIGLEQIIDRLATIVEKEGVAADRDALELVARRAGGSMRDSQSLLDQLLAFGGERLTAEAVHQVLGTAGAERVLALVEAILAHDAARCFTLVDEAIAAGVQLGEWIEQTIEYFRDLLVMSVSADERLVGVSASRRETLAEQANRLSPERIMEMMDILAHCRGRMRSSGYGRTLVEMSLVRLCRLEQFVSLGELMTLAPSETPPATAALDSKKNALALDPRPAESRSATPSFATGPAASSPPPSPSSPASAPSPVSAPTPASPPVETVALNAETLNALWARARATLTEQEVMLGGNLAMAERVSFDGPGVVTVYFPADRTTSKRYCEEPSRLAKINDVCSALAGQTVKLRFALLETPSSAPTAVPRPAGGYTHDRQRASQHPLVRKAEQTLGARLVDVVPAPAAAARPTVDQEKADE